METISSLVEQIAIWARVSGTCRQNGELEECKLTCEFNPNNPLVCKRSFCYELEKRIKKAVETSDMIDNL